MKTAGAMGLANRKYYSSKGKRIYSDFSTFAKGRALATANAVEFVRDFSNCNEAMVSEYGVGDGNFAKVFLNEVKKRDALLYGRVHYFLFDISGKMLSAAEKNLSAHRQRCSFEKFDAAHDSPFQQFDCCRINELLSDLPSELYFRKGNGIFSSDKKPAKTVPPAVSQFLSRVEQCRLIPFNFSAERFLLSLSSCGRENFRIDIFDYGFYSKDDLLLLPREEWNRLAVRKYGSQLTVDLNFPYLLASLSANGFQPRIEGQKQYCESALGFPLAFRQGKDSLDYSRAKKSGIEEDDGFYHLRIEK